MARRLQTFSGDARDAFSYLPSAIGVVTCVDNGRLYGMTLSAFLTLSVKPPQLLLSLERDTATLGAILNKQRFVLSLLSDSDVAIAAQCATPANPDKFAGLPLSDRCGTPAPTTAVAWYACKLTKVVSTEDHVLVVGAVLGTGVQNGAPLLRHRRRFGTFADSEPTR